MEKEIESSKEKKIRKITQMYYSNPEVQKAIYEFSKKREISPRYFEGFGKRPDSLQFKGDVFSLAKKGATSFHCSEELWSDPLKIDTGMTKDQADELRIGWDLLIDIDCEHGIKYSKLAAKAIVETFKQHGIKNVGVKFSVVGDTPILIKEKDQIFLTPISEVIKKLRKKVNLRIMSLNEKGKICFSKIYDYLEHDDLVYEIFHSRSTIPVKATGHHSVFVWNNGMLIQKKVSEIKNGDFLISYNSEKNPFSKKGIIAKHEFTFGKNQNSMKKVLKKLKVTPELLRLIGYYLAEGHVTNIINQTGFSFNKNEEDYIEDVKNLLKSITGRKISIRHPSLNSTQILIHSKEWANFFETFCGKKKDKHLPDFSFKLPENLFLEMLKGYIRGDGYKIGKDGIVVKSVSKRLITEFVWLCKLNNISCNLSSEKNKEHIMPQGTKFKGGLVYLLRIPKSELEKLEFYRKRNKFSPYARDKTFPTDGLNKIYNQIKPKMFNSHRVEQMTLKKRRANLLRIKKVLNWFEKFKEFEFDVNSIKILNNYKKLFNSDISVVEVKKILKKGKEKVYDVSVEKTEAFFGNYYPILLHNSGSKGFHILLPWKAFPKDINGIETKNLFPEMPRKLVAYIRNYSAGVLKSILPPEFEKELEGNLKTGYICKKCGDFATEFRFVEFKCNRCQVFETRKFKMGTTGKLPKCYKCKNEMNFRPLKKFIECERCKLNSNENPENFSREEKDIYSLMGLDLVLVSPRHLFRMPYSLHEKTSLVSAVLDYEELENFKFKDADPLRLKIKKFMPDVEENEAAEFVMQALDWAKSSGIDKEHSREASGKYENFKSIKLENLKDSQLPPTFLKILEGVKDGKKRGLFALINFFRSIGLEKEELEKRIFEWNTKNETPLKKGYITSQLTWSYRRKPLMPPNFSSEYYSAVGAIPNSEERRLKNPVSYTVKKNLEEKDKK